DELRYIAVIASAHDIDDGLAPAGDWWRRRSRLIDVQKDRAIGGGERYAPEAHGITCQRQRGGFRGANQRGQQEGSACQGPSPGKQREKTTGAQQEDEGRLCCSLAQFPGSAGSGCRRTWVDSLLCRWLILIHSS